MPADGADGALIRVPFATEFPPKSFANALELEGGNMGHSAADACWDDV